MKKITLLLLVVCTSLACAQKLPANVEESIRKRIEYGHTPSIAVGIIDKNGPRFYNFGSIKEGGNAVDQHTIYEIGSISKVFTAILLAQQVVDGKISLDDPIQKYLPKEVKVPRRGDKEITLGTLSDHTSALPRMPTNFTPADPSNPYADYTVQQMYDFISGYTLTRDIGSAYEYSNLAQGLLGHILSLKAGKPYEQIMIETIASPLSMNETKITLDEAMQKQLAIGHSSGREVSNWDIPTLAAAGGIRSSTSDMLKFLAANLGLAKTKLRKAMDLSHTVRHDKTNYRVGLGWHIAKGKNGDVIWHNGGTGGYRTFAGFVKETGTGVVVLTNSSEGSDDIGFHLLNPDSPLKEVKKGVAMEIQNTINNEGLEAAEKKFEDLKTNKSYDFNEMNVNTLGYYYLNDKKNLKAAIAIFKLNMEKFPNSSNVYDSYGEALLEDGQKELAIENYKKSIELNPGNQNGIDVLKKLGVEVAAGDVEVSEGTLEKYVGTYELMQGFNIEITRSGNRLFEQATGQSKFEIFPKSKTEFYLKVVPAQIVFNIVEGNVESMTLIQNGQNIKGKKVK